MKLLRWQVAAAIALAFATDSVQGQIQGRFSRPIPQTIGYSAASYQPDAVPSPSSTPSELPADAPASEGAPEESYGCTTGPYGTCTDCCGMDCPEMCPPWRLFGNCCAMQNHGIEMRGWLAGGMFVNFDDPPSNFNGPVTFGDRDSEFQMNQLYLIGEKKADGSDGSIGIGGRIDVLYGTDYRFNIARGLSARDNFTAKWDSGRFYGLDVAQAYGEVAKDNLSVKVGRFYTIIGYQVVTAPDNFFYSIPYTFQYGEPFTHTGLLATWTANEQLTVMAGVTNGWDNFDDVLGHQSILFGTTLTSSDSNDKLAFAMHIGKDETTYAQPDGPLAQRFVYSVVYSRTITDRLSYIFQHDNGRQDNAAGSGQQAEWYGVNQYLFYKVDCNWTAGIRMEWFRDDDGYRVAAPGDYAALGTSNNPASAGGWAGNFYNVALGLNWKPTSNLTLRPEARYDWYNGPQNAGNNDPFNDGTSNNQWLIGGDIIYLF